MLTGFKMCTSNQERDQFLIEGRTLPSLARKSCQGAPHIFTFMSTVFCRKCGEIKKRDLGKPAFMRFRDSKSLLMLKWRKKIGDYRWEKIH